VEDEFEFGQKFLNHGHLESISSRFFPLCPYCCGLVTNPTELNVASVMEAFVECPNSNCKAVFKSAKLNYLSE